MFFRTPVLLDSATNRTWCSRKQRTMISRRSWLEVVQSGTKFDFIIVVSVTTLTAWYFLPEKCFIPNRIAPRHPSRCDDTNTVHHSIHIWQWCAIIYLWGKVPLLLMLLMLIVEFYIFIDDDTKTQFVSHAKKRHSSKRLWFIFADTKRMYILYNKKRDY